MAPLAPHRRMQASTASLERVKVLWEKGEQHRAITELQQVGRAGWSEA